MAGCALNPPPTTEELRKDALPHTEIPAGWRAAGGAAAPVADRWLATFDDLALTSLVTEAQSYNADLAIAAARVEQAAGYVGVASGALYPWVNLAGTYSGASGGGGGLNAVFLNASLELDVWGRLRYATAAAEAQSAAVQADYAVCPPVHGGDGGKGLVRGHRSGIAARGSSSRRCIRPSRC